MFKMAAFLCRSGRVCRQIALQTARYRTTFQYNVRGRSESLKEGSLYPRFSFVRRFCDALPEEKVEVDLEVKEAQKIPDQSEQEQPTLENKQISSTMLQYLERRGELGKLSNKNILFRTVNAILEKEGTFSPSEACKIIQNCNADGLVSDIPARRLAIVDTLWKKILDSGVKADIPLYNSLLTVYVQNENDFDPLEMLSTIQNNELEPDLNTMQLLMKAFGLKGDIDGVFKILEMMKSSEMSIDERGYSGLVLAYGKSGDMEGAKGVFDIMKENGIEPGVESYIALLRSYAEAKDLDAVNQTMAEMQESNVMLTKDAYSVLFDILAKSGQLDIISKMLEDTSVRSLFEKDFKDFVVQQIHLENIDAALFFVDYLPLNEQAKRNYVITRLIRLKVPVEAILKMMDKFIENASLSNDLKSFYEIALEASHTKQYTELSLELIKLMTSKGIQVKEHYFYPMLIRQQSDLAGINKTFNLMEEAGLTADNYCFNVIRNAYKDNNQFSQVKSLIGDGQLSSAFVGLMAEFAMTSHNIAELREILDYSCKNNMNMEILHERLLILAKNQNNMLPGPYVAILSTLKKYKVPRDPNYNVKQTNMWEYWSRKSEFELENSIHFIQQMLDQDLGDFIHPELYYRILRSLTTQQMMKTSLEFIEMLEQKGVKFDQSHFRVMMKVYGYFGNEEKAEFCLNKIVEEGGELDVYNYSDIIKALGNNADGSFGMRMSKEVADKIITYAEGAVNTGRDMFMEKRSKSYVVLAHLALRNVEEAEKARERYGVDDSNPDEDFHFVHAYSRRRDVPNILKYFENTSFDKGIREQRRKYFEYILMGLSGEQETQLEVFNTMKEKNVKVTPSMYYALLKPYLKSGDVDGAFKLLEEAKSEGKYFSPFGCISMAYLCGKRAPEKLEAFIDECYSSLKANDLLGDLILQGLAMSCISADRTDLADRLVKDTKEHLYGKLSASYFVLNEYHDAMVKTKEYLDERSIDSSRLLVPLMKSYVNIGDYENALVICNQYLDTGRRPWSPLLKLIEEIFQKNGQAPPALTARNDSHSVKSDYQDDMDFSSDSEEELI